MDMSVACHWHIWHPGSRCCHKRHWAAMTNSTAGGNRAAEAEGALGNCKPRHLVQLAAALLHLAEPQDLAHGAEEALGAPVQLRQIVACMLASDSNTSTISGACDIQ